MIAAVRNGKELFEFLIYEILLCSRKGRGSGGGLHLLLTFLLKQGPGQIFQLV